MKIRKEIIGIIGSLALLGFFISLWLNSVYYQELNALKAEANVIFFNSLEEANDKLFIGRRIHQRMIKEHPGTWVIDERHNTPTDTLGLKEIIIFESSEEVSDTFIQSNTMKIVAELKNMLDSSENMAVTLNTSSSHRIRVDADSSIFVDFSSTIENLASILDTNIFESNLPKLQVKVLANPSKDTLIKNSFITNSGSLGNLFLGTNEYAAAFANYKRTIFSRMIPEMIFGLLLFLAIAFAFLMIYRSLLRERQLAIAKDDFISNMTHEFKTPISVISVAIEALKSFDVLKYPEKANEYLDLSKSELNRLTTMVDNVMNLSKLENKIKVSQTKEIDVDKVIARTVDSLRLAFQNKNQKLEFINKGESHKIQGVERNIESIISNILDNANKYGKEGGNINVTLSDKESQIQIEISDDGPGIPEEYRNRIFEKFYRIPTHNIHDVKGHGLGLHYVHELVKQHKGSISVSDNAKNGTTS